MTFELLDFLRNNENPLKILEEKYCIKVKRHSEFNNILLLKYNQLDSPMSEKLVQQCRGIIVDESDNWNVVCRTFDRFFNHSESYAAKIDYNSARIYEKLDGSLIQLFHYKNEWRAATSGVPCASGEVMGHPNITFADLFWKVWKDVGYQLPKDPNICYSFELLTPFNIIVTQHKESSIILTGARRLSDFRELNPVVEAHRNKWECVKIFDFKDKDEIINFLRDMNGFEQEGFVACDPKNYNRVKMKCEDYVKKHRLVSSVSIRNILDVIRTNEGDEFISYCPQFKDLYYDIRVKYEYLVGKAEGFYSAIKDIDDRKKFAMVAKDQIFSGILFGLKYNKISNVREALADMNIKHLEIWLKVKDIKI